MKVDTPQVHARAGISLVWIIPVLTALVGGWLIIKTVSEQGPVATISFLTADGIEVGSTRIKYKNVNIGVVEGMEFSEDFSHVMLTARFNHGMDSFLRRNTRFWVVRPQLGLRGVSGLDTLVSGAYIEIEPGQGAPQLHFVGLEKPPVVRSEVIGRKLVLISNRLGSLDTGSPVYYKGIQAGEVLGYELANDHRSVYIHVFVNDPYDQLIRGNTRFWNASGMQVDVGADGVKVRTESLSALVFGGIAFDNPEVLEGGGGDLSGLVYTLYPDEEAIRDELYTRKINYVAYFDGSVRGLSPGAPVEFRGIKVGSVLDYRLEYDQDAGNFRIPVLMEIEPERIMLRDSGVELTSAETISTLIAEGLRARLQTGSLITGQLFVELTMEPDAPPAELLADGDLPVMPTVATASIGAITESLSAMAARLESLDIEAIGSELLATLQGANALMNSRAVQSSIDNLEGSMAAFRRILESVDNADPGGTITAGRNVLISLDDTLKLANSAMQPDSPMHYNLIRLTGELEETARSIRALLELLERNPQSLLFGRGKEGE